MEARSSEGSDLVLAKAMIEREHDVIGLHWHRAEELGKAGAAPSELKSIIRKLSRLYSEHFDHEEHFMEQIAYPKYEIHKLEHDCIATTFSDFLNAISDFAAHWSNIRLSLFDLSNEHRMGFDESLETYCQLIGIKNAAIQPRY